MYSAEPVLLISSTNLIKKLVPGVVSTRKGVCTATLGRVKSAKRTTPIIKLLNYASHAAASTAGCVLPAPAKAVKAAFAATLSFRDGV